MGKKAKLRSLFYNHDRPCLALCAGKHCARAGTRRLFLATQEALANCELSEQVEVVITKCQDHCDDAPVMNILPDDVTCKRLTRERITEIVEQHLRNGQPLPMAFPGRRRKY